MRDNEKQIKEFEKCPICGENGKFVPPNRTEGGKLIVDFVCPKGHKFSKSTLLK